MEWPVVGWPSPMCTWGLSGTQLGILSSSSFSTRHTLACQDCQPHTLHKHLWSNGFLAVLNFLRLWQRLKYLRIHEQLDSALYVILYDLCWCYWFNKYYLKGLNFLTNLTILHCLHTTSETRFPAANNNMHYWPLNVSAVVDSTRFIYSDIHKDPRPPQTEHSQNLILP